MKKWCAIDRVIVLGLAVNFTFFLGYLFIVDSMTWVYFFTVSTTGTAFTLQCKFLCSATLNASICTSS